WRLQGHPRENRVRINRAQNSIGNRAQSGLENKSTQIIARELNRRRDTLINARHRMTTAINLNSLSRLPRKLRSFHTRNRAITVSNVRLLLIRAQETRPLVFLNLRRFIDKHLRLIHQVVTETSDRPQDTGKDITLRAMTIIGPVPRLVDNINHKRAITKISARPRLGVAIEITTALHHKLRVTQR